MLFWFFLWRTQELGVRQFGHSKVGAGTEEGLDSSREVPSPVAEAGVGGLKDRRGVAEGPGDGCTELSSRASVSSFH